MSIRGGVSHGEPGVARLQRRRFNEPSEVREFPRWRVDVFELDDNVFGRMTYEPGWRWSIDVKPVAGTDRCQYHHLGVTLQGRLLVEMPDGTELEIGPGDVFEIPPGHDASVVGDDTFVSVDFAGMRTYGSSAEERHERTLGSILLTDIVDSTARASAIGRGRWREVVAQHNELTERVIDRHGAGSSRRPATGSSHCSTAPSARSGPPRVSVTLLRHSNFRSAPASTPERWRSSLAISGAWRYTQ